MTTNDKIINSAYKAMLGSLPVENSAGGWCLRVVRQIVQDALEINHSQFYSRFMTVKAEGTNPGIPSARDVQLSLRTLGYGVPEEEIAPGDLFFSWKPMPDGHVGIMISRDHALENTSSSRPIARNRFLGVSALDRLRKDFPLEFFRLP
jgi:hypothetical protein